MKKITMVKESNHTGGSFTVWHGTNAEFENFDISKIGSNTRSAWNGIGFYFSDNEAEARLYGTNLIKCIIYLANPFDMTKIIDTSSHGSGVTRALANLDLYPKLAIECLNKIESKYDRSLVQIVKSKPGFNNIWIEYEDKEYAIYNRADSELSDANIKNLYVSKILENVYNITLAQKISDVCTASTFTNALKKNGYDGVIAHNSTVPTGNEYVVFNTDAIEIL